MASPQVNVVMAPVVLFEQVKAGGIAPPKEHGNCTCAIAAQPGDPPRYKLVCYSEGSVACSATIGISNEASLNFELQTADYASFKDDNGNVWFLMFLRSIDVEPFLANLAGCFFGASGQPTHTPTIADFAPLSGRSLTAPSTSGRKVEVGRRARCRFTAYSLRRATSSVEVPRLGELLETNGDAPFSFDAVQTPFAIPPEGKGFESSMLGAAEGAYRVVVIPQSMPRSAVAPMLNVHTLVFVVHVTKVATSDDVMTAATYAGSAGALVPVGGAPNVFGGAGAPTSTSNALVLASSPQASMMGAGAGGAPSMFSTPAPAIGAPGSGIPAEHMLLVQKLAGQLNTAVSTLRDLQDRVDAINSEYKQNLNKPQPSALSAAALEQGVKSLIMEHERLRDELLRRDELITALDSRNRDLQKAVDKAAMTAQQLMDEKKTAVSKTNDVKLDADRGAMKLQEQIMRARAERDDLARHLQTVKKLLDVSDTDLRDNKGRKEVTLVQLRGLEGKLEAAEEQLGEERSRRKALEAKAGALQDESRNGQAELHLKTAQLEDLRRKADAERVHSMQLMEDERSRRALESAQLRSEIIEELQQRERKFEADRARTQQEHFARGHDEGKDLGRKEARADFEVRMQELALEAQRAKTELDAFKDELRTAQDDATAEHRRLDAAISSLKRQVEEGTRNKASLEFQIQRAQVHVRGAEDKMILGVSALAHRLRRPISASELKDFISKLRAGDVSSAAAAAEIIASQEAQLDADSEALRAQRNGWVSEELAAAYSETLTATFHAAFELPLQAAHGELVATISRLLEERHAAEVSEIIAAEEATRRMVDSEQEGDFIAIEGVRTAQREERAAVEAEESTARAAVDAEADAWVAEAERHLAAQTAERADAEAAETRARAEVEDEERGGMKEIEEVVYAEAIAAQRAIQDEETTARGDAEVEQDVEFDTLAAAYGASLDEVRVLQAARAQFEAAVAVVVDGEASARATIDSEAYDEADATGREFRETMPLPPRAPTPPPTPPPPAPPVMPAVPAFGSDSDADAPAPAAASTSSTPRGAPAPAPASAPVAPAEEDEESVSTAPVVAAPPAPLPPVSDAAEAALDPLGGATIIASAANFDRGDITTVMPQPKVAPKPAAKAAGKSLFAGYSSDEDSDAAPRRPASPPAAKKSVAPPAKPAVAKTALFGSTSSDSDNEKPRPKPAAKAAAPKPAAKVAKLFGSDSD